MLIEQCWVSAVLSGTGEAHGCLLLWNSAPSCYAFRCICLLLIVFPILPCCQGLSHQFLLLKFYLSLVKVCLPPKVSALSSSVHLSSSLAMLLRVWFIDPVIHWSPRPFHGAWEVNTIFIVIVRHYLLLPVLWHLFYCYQGAGGYTRWNLSTNQSTSIQRCPFSLWPSPLHTPHRS